MDDTLKGTFSCGFKYSFKRTILDDWELVRLLRKMSESEEFWLIEDALTLILGKKQLDDLFKFLKKKNGRVATSLVTQCFEELMEISEAKN